MPFPMRCDPPCAAFAVIFADLTLQATYTQDTIVPEIELDAATAKFGPDTYGRAQDRCQPTREDIGCKHGVCKRDRYCPSPITALCDVHTLGVSITLILIIIAGFHSSTILFSGASRKPNSALYTWPLNRTHRSDCLYRPATNQNSLLDVLNSLLQL